MKPSRKTTNRLPQYFCILSVFLISGLCLLSAQDTLSGSKALNFPFRKYGISIGNSKEFNGIRINFADKNVTRINGVNVTFWLKKYQNYSASVNGISIGVIPAAGSMQPINLGILGVGTSPNNLNGLSLGGVFIGSGGNINGLSLSGLVIAADGDNSKISGISISGLGLGAAKSVNGLAIGGIMVNSGGNINGLATSLVILNCDGNFKGVAVTPGYMKSGEHKGIVFAGYAKTNQMNGLSVALYNRTEELRGIQFGLLNFAGNNPKGLKMLPLVNMHLGKDKNSDK